MPMHSIKDKDTIKKIDQSLLELNINIRAFCYQLFMLLMQKKIITHYFIPYHYTIYNSKDPHMPNYTKLEKINGFVSPS